MRKTAGVVMAAALFAIVAASFAGTAEARTVTKFNVFAAASLNKAFPAEAKAFKTKWPRYKNVKFVFNFQGTDTLVAQIQQGAPADVFAGASLKYGTTLSNANLIASPVSFCQNRLCVIVPSSNPAKIAALAEIPSKSYYVAIGSSTVPIGSYTSAVLDKMTASDAYADDYKTQIMAKAVTCLNVTQVVSLVMLGEVDAGFCYNSDAKYAGTKVKRIAIPNEFQTAPPPTYPIARTVSTKYPKLSQRFVNFVMSARGQQILKTWGFLPKPAATAAVTQ